MKIKLIAPHEQHEDTSKFRLKRVNLPLIAALTPPGHTITIVDEVFAPDDLNQEVDLVGITVMTDLVPRAYQIADAYRRKGVKVVMGGIHPTILPDEALGHADAVVVGEAEGVWPQVVSDAASGQLQRLYRAGKKTDLAGLPTPRRDLFPETETSGVLLSMSASRPPEAVRTIANSVAVPRPRGSNIESGRFTEVIAEIESIDAS